MGTDRDTLAVIVDAAQEAVMDWMPAVPYTNRQATAADYLDALGDPRSYE